MLAELQFGDDVELVSGHEIADLGHLDGRSATLLLPRVVGGEVEDKTKRHVEWVVKTKNPELTTVTIVARCPRAGVDRKQVSLA